MALKIPILVNCCICVTDLKSAAAIIAVLGIVTCPAVAWAVVRHSYVIRISCFVTASKKRRDILDINLNNIVSFGLGTNAGLEPSCLGQPVEKSLSDIAALSKHYQSTFFNVVYYYGWFVLFVDLFFLVVCLCFLIKIFRDSARKIALIFMYSAIATTIVSFIYGMLYVSACITVGGAFPIFEFAFCVIDVFVWIYFVLIVNSYRAGLTG